MHQHTRLDIQGLRAVAVIAVVLYHAGVPYISGGFVGVDVFFVLSGFLIIGLLTREVEKTHTVSLTNFWSRRARRLVPASSLVLITTVLVSSVVLPFLDRKAVALDILFASLFSANWRFAQQQTDYLAAERSPSPVEHFWSLGVEEQFYFAIPLLFVFIAMCVRFSHQTVGTHKATIRPRVLIGVVLTAITVTSLAVCIWASAYNPSYAFFGTHTRAWQLASGGLLALMAPALSKLGYFHRHRMAVVGWVLLTVSLVLLSNNGQAGGLTYPSILAILPTVAALLLLAGGFGEVPTFVTACLSVRPLTFIGDISYSLYLWHWPFLVLGVAALKNDSLAVKLGLVAAATVAAIVTYFVVENPIRKSTLLTVKLRPAVSLAFAALLLAMVFPLSHSMSTQTFEASTIYTKVFTPAGETSFIETVNDTVVGLTPTFKQAREDVSGMEQRGCKLTRTETTVPKRSHCSWGDGGKSVMVLGDSIAASVFPGIKKAALAADWTVTGWMKSSCPIGFVRSQYTEKHGEFTQCHIWRDAVLKKTINLKPDVVLLAMSGGSYSPIYDPNSGNVVEVGSERERSLGVAGLTKTVTMLQDAGIDVGIIESPISAPFFVPDCLVEKQSVSACEFPRSTTSLAQRVAAQSDQVTYIKLSDQYCHQRTCQPVANRIIIYRDGNHYTKTFALTFSPIFTRILNVMST